MQQHFHIFKNEKYQQVCSWTNTYSQDFLTEFFKSLQVCKCKCKSANVVCGMLKVKTAYKCGMFIYNHVYLCTFVFSSLYDLSLWLWHKNYDGTKSGLTNHKGQKSIWLYYKYYLSWRRMKYKNQNQKRKKNNTFETREIRTIKINCNVFISFFHLWVVAKDKYKFYVTWWCLCYSLTYTDTRTLIHSLTHSH